MTLQPVALPPLAYYPLTPERWPDLEALFGPRGACMGCWCMYWRLKRSQFNRQLGEGNRQALRAMVEAGQVPGILAYARAQPVAWCSVGPREAYPTLDRSPLLKRVDEQPVWSVVCFFVAPAFRRRGLLVPLLLAAVEYARARGASIVEGYPDAEPPRTWSGSAGYMGLLSTFQQVGFVEALRRSPRRPIMRWYGSLAPSERGSESVLSGAKE